MTDEELPPLIERAGGAEENIMKKYWIVWHHANKHEGVIFDNEDDARATAGRAAGAEFVEIPTLGDMFGELYESKAPLIVQEVEITK